MKCLFIILTLLWNLFLLQSVAVSQIPSYPQNTEQNKPQLTLEQIKERIHVYTNSKNEQDKTAIDKAIAKEISSRRVSGFQPRGSILNELRELGAGPQTLQALKALQKIVILVADFSSEDKKDHSMTQLLLDRLIHSTSKYDDVEVKALEETIPKRIGRKAAIAKGKEHNAAIVIWGWLDKSDEAVIISAHFEVIDEVHLIDISDSRLLGGIRELIAKLPELKWFTTQTRLRNELTAITLFVTGLSRLQAQDYKVAIALFSEALHHNDVLERNISDIYTARGQAYLYDEGSRSKNALNDFNEAIRTDADNHKARLALISIYLLEGRYDDVISHGKKLLEYESSVEIETALHFLIANSYVKKNEPDKAQHYYDKLLQLPEGNPPSPSVLHLHGMTHMINGNYKSALEYYERAIQLSDGVRLEASTRSSKGLAHLALEETDKAIKEFEESLRLDPKLIRVYSYLGRAYHAKGDYRRTVNNYNKYFELNNDELANPLNPEDPYIFRGEAYYYLGDKDKALEDYNRALALKPSVRALSDRAIVYLEKGQLDEPILDYSEVIRLSPNNAKAFFHRGYVYARKRLLDEALKDYNEAIRLDPNYDQAYLARGILQAKKGERDLAISDLQTALQKTNNPQLRQLAQKQLDLLGVK